MSQFIDVIECLDPSAEQIVSRWPSSGSAEIKLGAQLLVRDYQAAVFFRDGRALDTFGPGRHTLSTLNVPLITKALSLPTGFRSPFRAEVVFVNLRTFPNQKWGTSEPILFRDAELDMVRLRAFGIYSFRVAKPGVFVNTLVGSIPEYTTHAVGDFFRNLIVTHAADFLGRHLETLLDLPQYYTELSAGIEAHAIADFEKYGIAMSDFRLLSISPPDYVQEMIDKRSSMAALSSMETFLHYQAAKALVGAAGQPGAGDGGGADGLAGAGLGAGVGVGMGAGMAQLVARAFGFGAPESGGGTAGPGSGPGTSQSGPTAPCGSCQARVAAGANFCPQCGRPQQEPPCENCGSTVPARARFCPGCGQARVVPA
jgi:membrane protease subunit (stomatin/prohibitin family)